MSDEQRKVSEIVFRSDLYPRIASDPLTVQKYAEDLSVLPPIEVNQHNEIIDGWHRWTAHKKAEVESAAKESIRPVAVIGASKAAWARIVSPGARSTSGGAPPMAARTAGLIR